MKHINILLIKLVASYFILWISLGVFFNATFAQLISFSLLITLTSYFIGDLILLPRIGKRNAAIADFFLVYLTIWLFGAIFFHNYLQIAWGSIIAATLIAGSEVFVHSYILKNTKPIVTEKQQSFNNQRFAFEVAEEQHPNPPYDRKKED